jgi:hypothetical protein
MPESTYSEATSKEPAPSNDKLVALIKELRLERARTKLALDPLVEELRRIIGHNDFPDRYEFDDLKAALERLLHTHWDPTEADKEFFLEVEKPARERQKCRLAYLDYLVKERARISPEDPFGNAERHRLNALIAAIEADKEPIWEKDFFGANHQYSPWALTVRDIGRRLLAGLQSADRNAGLPPRTTFNEAAIGFVVAKLPERINADESPSRDDIVRILRKLEA